MCFYIICAKRVSIIGNHTIGLKNFTSMRIKESFFLSLSKYLLLKNNGYCFLGQKCVLLAEFVECGVAVSADVYCKWSQKLRYIILNKTLNAVFWYSFAWQGTSSHCMINCSHYEEIWMGCFLPNTTPGLMPSDYHWFPISFIDVPCIMYNMRMIAYYLWLLRKYFSYS